MNSHPKVYFGRGGVGAVLKVGGKEMGLGGTKLKKKPTVYMGRAGITTSLVLQGGGISRGGLNKIGRKLADKAQVKADGRGDVKPEEEKRKTEERLADFLEVAQAVVESDEGTKPNPPAETAESIALREETSKAEETRGVLSELPQGEMFVEGVKKRRKRRGRKAKGSTEVAETERAAIQAELEAAGAAADNDNN